MKHLFREGKKIEWIIFILFIVMYIVIAFFHEPWFDEAQAWQIAKCASIKDILLEIPHYEGHPPFWWLILAVPAKAGVPFELGLKGIGFIISVISIYLILFKLSCPRMVRLIIPFTYFIFYQYGIIVRPYGLMMLSFILLAIAFPNRAKHPWRFVLILVLLCLTSAYGIVLAGGIALCLVWELISDNSLKNIIVLLKDKRAIPLCTLLIIAILIILSILPRENTWVTSSGAENSFILCLICSLFTFISECTLTTSSWFSADRVLLQNANLSTLGLILISVIGIILWALLIFASSRKLLKYLIVPYLLFAVFSSLVYFAVHHIGIIVLFLLFWFSTLFQDNNRFEIGKRIARKIARTNIEKKMLKIATALLCFACLLIPVYWTVRASINEIRLEYSYGRSTASFITNNNLQDKVFFSSWGESTPMTQSIVDGNYLELNTFEVGNPVLINAYFDKNICMNLNNGNDREAYMQYKVADRKERIDAINNWRLIGIPDIILGRPEIELVYGDSIDYDNYSLVWIMKANYIWKDRIAPARIPLYASNKTINEKQLRIIEDKSLQYWVEGIVITEEMRKAYENGVSVEDLLEPYFEEMFSNQQ